MSSTTTSEDTELRDLVAETLDNSGVLGKIKAQLRANVYLALEEGEPALKTKSRLVNPPLCSFLSTTNGRLVASLVREFLEFFSLDFSLAVFDPETNIGRDFKYRERDKLIDALGLTELTDTKSPLLSEIMRLSKVSVLKSESPTPTEISEEEDLHTSAATSLGDDLVVGAVTDKNSDNSRSSAGEKSDSSTPEIVLKDSSLDLMLGRTFTQEKVQTQNKDLLSRGNKEAPSFLTDLPPLGGLPKSSLGDLPPLSLGGGRATALAPLGGRLHPPPKSAADVPLQKPPPPMSEPIMTRVKSQAPSFGFEPDHVLSQKDDLSTQKSKKETDPKESSGETTPEVTENIEEELDSFLNSEISGGDDLTKDETLANSDASLKVDYVESL